MLARLVLSAVSGLLLAFSFPNVAQGWLAFVALAPLLVAIVRARGGWEAFFQGWISSTVAWLVMVPWVIRVMSHYGGLPLFAGILIFAAMAIYLGVYGGLFSFLVWRLRLGDGFGRWLLVPLAWAAVEYVRTYLFSGFPWNLIATAIVDDPSLIQFDRVAGPYLVGAMIVVPSAAIAWLVTRRVHLIGRVVVIGSVAIFLFVWWGTGLVAAKLLARPTGVQPLKAALLQPNISQEMRWNEQNLLDIYQRMIGMTMDAIANKADVVIWPESTVPLSYNRTAFYRESIEQISREHGVDIILGSVAEDPQATTRLWNAAFLVSGGRTIGHYDKIKLVPFGEYVPLRKMLFFAEKLVRAVGEFSFGTNDRPLRGKLAYGPAICYEVVFPQIPRTQVVNGADVLVTITNDAWYDGTSAPRQHLNMARLRAVETDRYLLRAATTGVSVFVDPAGRIVREIEMGKSGIIYAEFEARKKETPYVKYGDWFAWGAMGAVMIAIFWKRR